MIILKIEVLKNYLELIGKNQKWLAQKMCFTEGYISQVINNVYKVSANFIERILLVTNLDFNDLFDYDGSTDTREGYPPVHPYEGKNVTNKRHFERVRQAELSHA